MLTNETAVAARIALGISRESNRDLLDSQFDEYDVVDVDGSVPEGTDLCIVDERAFARLRPDLVRWKDRQSPTHAPVLLIARQDGTNPWKRHADAMGTALDAIQPIPTPTISLQARVKSLLDARHYSRQLARERQFVERIIEMSPIAVTVLDTDGNILQANRRAEEVLGLSKSDLSGRAYDSPAWNVVDKYGDPIPSDDLPFARVMETGDPVYGYEHGIERPDGELAWLSVNMDAIRNEAGDIEYLVGAIDDVTDRVRVERERRRVSKSRSLALSAAQAGVWEWNLEADEVVWHESCERLFGLEPGAFEGTYEAFADRVHPADRSTLEAAIERTLAHGDTFQATYRIVRDDGETRWLDGRGEMFFDDAGRPERLLGVALDVTEQKERERDLEQYETIIETADDPIYALDAEGTITLANEGFTAAVGRSKDDLIGTNITTVLDPEDVEASLEHIRTLAEGEKEPGTVDLTLDGANGTRQFEVDISLVEDDETGTSQETGADRVPGTVGVARDVTELRDRLQQLQVLDRVLRHNLRNDMTVIRGNAETIEQTASEPVSTYADRIVTYSDKLIGLTEKQREITRVLAAEPSRTTEDAVAVCRQIVDSLSAVHPDTEFVLDVPERAPVVATENLQRAIEELVTNAIEHSDRDRPRVGVTVDVADETVDISVTDDGPGIPAMERDIVTGKHDIDPLFHGRGLGLWLVSRIVRRSNGTLSFAESERRGTTVTISLPLATSDAKTDVEQ